MDGLLSPLVYGVLADLVVFVHGTFVLFVVVGGLVALRWPRVVWFHAPAVLWGSIVELAGWGCPLTPLENWLRALGDQAGYAGSFVERYLLPILYPEHLTRALQVGLGVAVLLVNLVIYSYVLRRHALAELRAGSH
jgi:hypothetical protein